jgi:hypothetical protein
MADMTLNMKHPTTGEFTSAPLGFSWTTFFFGFFPPLFRGDFKTAAAYFAFSLIAGLIAGPVGPLVLWLVVAFIYNKMYAKSCLRQGYLLTSVQGGNIDRAARRLGIDEEVLKGRVSPGQEGAFGLDAPSAAR